MMFGDDTGLIQVTAWAALNEEMHQLEPAEGADAAVECWVCFEESRSRKMARHCQR